MKNIIIVGLMLIISGCIEDPLSNGSGGLVPTIQVNSHSTCLSTQYYNNYTHNCINKEETNYSYSRIIFG